ncbi:MAG TPA: bifunctional ADP-dependent NAD(P)H-hydrate dehydratase/NAD(P)H-hydrate epimerase [Lachnospiraceae bacterium]|nr:bifunctional ADP-dependent NAD(P)H-hydrate dehydratase/NAD(P)H-hydrate epimerase [Lachnospiraceae bacterium]
MKVASAAQIREMDRLTIEETGIPGIVLMENAAQAVAKACLVYVRKIENPRVAVVCGGGNNGGDGFAVARILKCKGVESKIIFIGNEEKLTSDSLTNYRIAQNFNITIITDISDLEQIFCNEDVIIDGIFGTGFNGEPRAVSAEVIRKINQSGKYVISIDIPSGVNADTGKTAEICVKADETITFGLPKIGTILYPGAKYCGNLTVDDICIPQKNAEKAGVLFNVLTQNEASKWLPIRKEQSNKGTFGKLYIIAASEEMTGAGVFSCKAGYKSGCGLVYACMPKKCCDVVHMMVPEAIAKPLSDIDGKVHENSIKDIKAELENAKAIVIGPGMGQSEGVSAFVEEVLLTAKGNVLVDADGLNAIVKNKAVLKDMKCVPIITPHPGEMSRLTGIPIKDILDNTLETALNFAMQYNTIVVLKDAKTVIASPSGDVYINTTGNCAMAKAGAGDVLSGIIGGLLAQGMDSLKAAVLGVYVHGCCGDLAADKMGHYGVMASELADYVALSMKKLEELQNK